MRPRPARRLLALAPAIVAVALALTPAPSAVALSAADTPADTAQLRDRSAALLALVAQAPTLSPGIVTEIPVAGASPFTIRARSNPDRSIAVAGVPRLTTALIHPDASAPTHVAIDEDGDGTIDMVYPILADGLGGPLPRSAWGALALPATLVSDPMPAEETAMGNQDEAPALGNLGGDRPGANIPGGGNGGFGSIIGENNSNAASPTRP
jgi:hypothetical protein